MKKQTAVAAVALVLAFSGLSTLAGIEPAAAEVLRRMAGEISGTEAFAVDIITNMKIEAEGMKQNFVTESTFAIRKPAQMAMVLKSGMLGATVVSDGTNLYTYVPMLDQYTVEPAPARLDDAAHPALAGMSAGFPLLYAFLADDPYDALVEGVASARVLGRENIDGVECIHVRIEQEEMNWDAWITGDEKPRLWRVVPDMEHAMQEMAAADPSLAAQLRNMRYDLRLDFRRWKGAGELADDQFVFTPPASASREESFALEQEDPEHALMGREAPAFSVDTLDGERFNLADYRGQVVMLDFWATWCGPCRRALPVLAAAAEDFRERGVVFLAVNQREEESVIHAFMEREGLDFAVGLDRDGSIGRQYEVSGIPQTVLVGRDGKVASVHVGMLPNLKEILEQELSALIAQPGE